MPALSLGPLLEHAAASTSTHSSAAATSTDDRRLPSATSFVRPRAEPVAESRIEPVAEPAAERAVDPGLEGREEGIAGHRTGPPRAAPAKPRPRLHYRAEVARRA